MEAGAAYYPAVPAAQLATFQLELSLDYIPEVAALAGPAEAE
jgi:hypothetical protein